VPGVGRVGAQAPGASLRVVLVLHFDTTSPASAVAVLRLEALVAEGLDVGFLGFDVLGLTVAVPPTWALLAELEHHRVAAAALGLDLQAPRWQPPTLACHVAGDVAEAAGLGSAWRRATLEAFWGSGADIASPTVLGELAAGLGLDPALVRTRVTDPVVLRRARAAMTQRRHGGLGGVPVIEIDGTLVAADLDDEALRQLARL